MEQFSKGFVIGTFGSPAYVDLQLALHVGKWGHDCIVVDDGSRDRQLAQICDKWKVPLFGWDCKRQSHQNGDACVFYCGLTYFRDRDFTFKISRRFIWLKDFSLYLPEGNYAKSPLLTDWWVPNKDFQNNIAIATCCVGMFNSAITQEHLNQVQILSDTANRTDNFMQKGLRNVFSDLQSPVIPWRSVYISRGYQTVSKDILWWKRTVNYQAACKRLSDQLDLEWSLRDFQV